MNGKSIVVLPWDFSLQSIAALDYAIQRFASSNIRVICVLEPPNPYQMEVGWGPEAEEKTRTSCVEKFFEVANQVRDTGLQFFVEFGDPADEIVRFSQDQGADYIVMSTHGRTGIKRLFMGSVAQKVAAQSRLPIILLPGGWFAAQSSETEPENRASSS